MLPFHWLFICKTPSPSPVVERVFQCLLRIVQVLSSFLYADRRVLPDEINVEDISFIQWTLLSRYAIFEEDEVIIQNLMILT